MSKMIVGAQLYTARTLCQTIPDLVDTLKKVAAIGYTAVQVSGLPDALGVREVGKVLADSGLTVAATHVSWEKLLKDPESIIEQHRLWKCEHVAIGGLPGEYYANADGVKRFIGELATVAPKLAAAGMDFSYHNHNHELVRYGNQTWLGMLYEQADPRILKAELDTYWITAGGGDPAQWVRKCAGRQPLLHVKDMIIMPDRTLRFAEIGEGNLNWAAIIKAASDGGVQHVLVEQDKCYDRTPIESLAISYRNLKAMGLS
ncbi:MAG: sugar phosphate isomerase/epimerase [Phycisphaerae bacterium]|nr:sugar phosphate isomerase/epimerase [Phycisphaerae bacterium]